MTGGFWLFVSSVYFHLTTQLKVLLLQHFTDAKTDKFHASYNPEQRQDNFGKTVYSGLQL